MKNIIFKSIACILLVVMLLLTLASCIDDGPNYPHHPPHHDEEPIVELSKEEVLDILKRTANDYLTLEKPFEVEAIEKGTTSVKPVIEVNQETFLQELSEKNLDENEVLADSKYFFEKAVISAIKIVEASEKFELGKIYNPIYVNIDGNTVENSGLCKVGLISADDGGIYVLYYDDSIIENQTVQVTYYLAVENGVSIIRSSAIYAGKNAEDKGVMIVDYVQFVAGKTIETASATFAVETAEEARRIAKLVNDKADAMREIKKNAIAIEYAYAAIVSDTWTTKGASFTTENGWTQFMDKVFGSLTNSIRTYGADFSTLFTENLTDITIVEKPVVEIPEETTGDETTDESSEEVTNSESTESTESPSEESTEITEIPEETTGDGITEEVTNSESTESPSEENTENSSEENT